MNPLAPGVLRFNSRGNVLHPAPNKQNHVGSLPESYVSPEQAEDARRTLVTYFGDHPDAFKGIINSQYDAEDRKRSDAAIELAKLQRGLSGKAAKEAAKRALASTRTRATATSALEERLRVARLSGDGVDRSVPARSRLATLNSNPNHAPNPTHHYRIPNSSFLHSYPFVPNLNPSIRYQCIIDAAFLRKVPAHVREAVKTLILRQKQVRVPLSYHQASLFFVWCMVSRSQSPPGSKTHPSFSYPFPFPLQRSPIYIVDQHWPPGAELSSLYNKVLSEAFGITMRQVDTLWKVHSIYALRTGACLSIILISHHCLSDHLSCRVCLLPGCQR